MITITQTTPPSHEPGRYFLIDCARLIKNWTLAFIRQKGTPVACEYAGWGQSRDGRSAWRESVPVGVNYSVLSYVGRASFDEIELFFELSMTFLLAQFSRLVFLTRPMTRSVFRSTASSIHLRLLRRATQVPGLSFDEQSSRHGKILQHHEGWEVKLLVDADNLIVLISNTENPNKVWLGSAKAQFDGDGDEQY